MATKAKPETKTASKKAVKPTTKPEAKKAAHQVLPHRCIVRWRDEEGGRRQERTASETEAKRRVTELTKEGMLNPRYELEK